MQKDPNLWFPTNDKVFWNTTGFNFHSLKSVTFRDWVSASHLLPLEDTLQQSRSHFSFHISLLSRDKTLFCLPPIFMSYDSATTLSIWTWVDFAKVLNRVHVRIAYFVAISSKTYVLSVLIKSTDPMFCVSDTKHSSLSKTHLMLLLTEEDLIILFSHSLNEYFLRTNSVLPSPPPISSSLNRNLPYGKLNYILKLHCSIQ